MTWDKIILPATSSTRVLNPRLLSYMASCDVAGNIRPYQQCRVPPRSTPHVWHPPLDADTDAHPLAPGGLLSPNSSRPQEQGLTLNVSCYFLVWLRRARCAQADGAATASRRR